MARLLHRFKPLLKLDWAALSATFLLLLTGVVFIFSAGLGDEGDALLTSQGWKQLGFVVVGFPLYLTVSLIDYRRFRDLAPLIYIGCLVLLVGFRPGEFSTRGAH